MEIVLKKEDRTIRLLALVVNWNVITGLIESMSKIPGLSLLASFSNITILISLLFIVLTILFTIDNLGNWPSYLIMVIWLILFAISYMINPRIIAIAPRAFIYFTNNIFCIAVLLQSISDLQPLVDTLKKYIPIAVFYAILQWIVGINGEVYSMSFSYSTMVTALLCMLLSIMQNERRFWYFLSFLILLFTNFRYGSRGAFACYALALVLNFCYSAVNKKLKILATSITVILVIAMAWDSIMSILARTFQESRNVVILTQGLMFYGSGRGELYRAIIDELIKKPYKIRGLYSDRYFFSGVLPDVNELWGNYSHNFFLELLYQFGIWVIPVIIILLVCLIRSFMRARNTDEGTKIVFLIVYAFSIGQLLISSSYLISPSFGLLIGILLWAKRYLSAKAAKVN